MKTTSILLAVILTLGSFVPSVSQSNKGKTVSSLKDESINKDENINTANEFRPGTVFAVDTTNRLLHFDVTTPGRIDGSVNITNLQPGENILAIDFRPATGSLYGLGSTSQLYVINLVTGFASPVGNTFSPALAGTAFGFDFLPGGLDFGTTSDRIRVVSDIGQNLRLNANTGAVTNNDPPTNPAGTVGSAYTNNFPGATTTTLYGIDSNTDQLVIQNPPDDGVVTPVGPLGFDTSTLVGFDIQAGSNIAYASLTAPAAMLSNFFTVNLGTGVVTLVGSIAAATIRGIAVVSGPETVFAVTIANRLLRFNSNSPFIVSATPILGLQPGENILAIDFRPATGELYGLGSTSRLYKIDTANGQATAVGAGPFTPALSGTDFGFDFNPTVDRIRVVSDAEQNLRLHPDLGTVAFVDTPLNPPGNVVAAAYTNNFAGATSTLLYDIDSNADLLLTQNPPNNGELHAVGPLNVNTTGLAGLDIARNGLAFASFTAASSSRFYRVNLATGEATLLFNIPGNEALRDIAVRLTAEIVYGVTQNGATFNLITFNAATPSVIISTVPITGLQAGESILGIDFRPATGGLYALGSTSRLYTIDPSTGVATAVGPAFTPALNGTDFGFDFNATVDRIRVVSDAEQNLSLNPNTAAVTVNGNLNPPGNIVAAAYTNNFSGATATTLYDIDSASNQLFTQVPATGALSPVGVGLGVDIGPTVGFDITPGSGIAYVSGYTGGPSPGLYILNLAAGSLTLVGNINTTDTLIGIAVRVSGTPIAGVDSPGVYHAPTGTWFLRNSNSAGLADTTFSYGPGGAAIPIKGDWDGDGDDTAAVYFPASATFFLRNTNASGIADTTFVFGPGGPGLIPVTGDWDGDGQDSVGVYNTSNGVFFLRNANSGGPADFAFSFGTGGALPITGDWNGDSVDTIGIYVPGSGTFFLRNANSNGPADITPFTFGAPNSTPLAGDWNGDGTDTIGIYQSATGAWFLSNGFTGATDVAFTYGAPGQTPLVGDWDGQ